MGGHPIFGGFYFPGPKRPTRGNPKKLFLWETLCRGFPSFPVNLWRPRGILHPIGGPKPETLGGKGLRVPHFRGAQGGVKKNFETLWVSFQTGNGGSFKNPPRVPRGFPPLIWGLGCLKPNIPQRHTFVGGKISFWGFTPQIWDVRGKERPGAFSAKGFPTRGPTASVY